MATFCADVRCPPATARRDPARRSVLLLVLCLTLATGGTLLGAAAALTADPGAVPVAGSSAANADLVHAFYAAVNDAVRTGDAGALDAILAPDVAWCSPCPDQAPTLDGLKRYLAVLHKPIPDARLTVESVVADVQDTVMARVQVAGFPLVGQPMPWGSVDTFRLVSGLIAERRSGPTAIALVEPLLAARLDPLPPAVTGLALARLTFVPGSGVRGLLSAGPTLLVVESGALAIDAAGGGRLLRAGADDSAGTTAANGTALAAVLAQGDAAIVPPGVRYDLLQHGAQPAVAVGATLFFDSADDPPQRWPKLTLFAPLGPTDRELGPPPLPPTVRVLAEGAMGGWPSGPVRVAVGRVILGPGGRTVPSAGESTLLAVEAGILGLVGDTERAVAAGTGVVQAAGTVGEVRNSGDRVLVLLVVTVAAVAD